MLRVGRFRLKRMKNIFLIKSINENSSPRPCVSLMLHDLIKTQKTEQEGNDDDDPKKRAN